MSDEEKVVGLDYEKENKNLTEKYLHNMDKLINKHEEELRNKDEKYRGIVNTQQDEINWLKSVIEGILHI